MPRNKIQDLQNHLFAQIENIADADTKQLELEIKKGKAMTGLASVIIDSAKAQIDFARVVKGEQNVSIPILEEKVLQID